MAKTVATGKSGRNAKGQFAEGNKAGSYSKDIARKTQILRQVFMDELKEEDIRQICRVLIRKAKRGQLAAIKEVMDRGMGKVPQAMELGGQDGEPLEVTFHVKKN